MNSEWLHSYNQPWYYWKQDIFFALIYSDREKVLVGEERNHPAGIFVNCFKLLAVTLSQGVGFWMLWLNDSFRASWHELPTTTTISCSSLSIVHMSFQAIKPKLLLVWNPWAFKFQFKFYNTYCLRREGEFISARCI